MRTSKKVYVAFENVFPGTGPAAADIALYPVSANLPTNNQKIVD